MWFQAECAGRFAAAALAAGPGEVCAVFTRSFYARFPGNRYACFGEAALGRGPLNTLVWRLDSLPARGERVHALPDAAAIWHPSMIKNRVSRKTLLSRLEVLVEAAAPPQQGLGGTIVGASTSLIEHARPALEAFDRFLGKAREPSASGQALIGLGPGLTPSGDDYLGGMLLALGALDPARRRALWNWLAPRLPGRTSEISRAHLAAAAAGEAHEALHACLEKLFSDNSPSWIPLFARLDAVGHCSGWDALAGAVGALRAA